MEGTDNMKVSFIIPEYVTDYYGRSAFHLMHELSSFESVVNECDTSCDIVFCTAFFDSKMKKQYQYFKKKYPKAIFVNYLWDLPFWRSDPERKQEKLFSFRDLLYVRAYPVLFKTWREQYEYYMKSGDVLLCSSQHTRNEVKKYYGIDSEVLYLYFPNIDIEECNLSSEKEDRIIYVGRIEEYKCVNVLIEAVSKLHNPTKLVIIGRGSKLEECASLARSLNVNVEFKGYLDRKDMHREVARSSVFVSPSVMEGNPGWGPCEAVWGGTPAIMADIPETREFFGDSAIYFKKYDSSSLAENLALMLGNQSRRDSIQRKSKEKISFYTVQNGISRLEKFCVKILKERR